MNCSADEYYDADRFTLASIAVTPGEEELDDELDDMDTTEQRLSLTPTRRKSTGMKKKNKASAC